jgi:hypothetical protein
MNRKFITVLFVLLLCTVAVGFYRGWFTLSSGSSDAGSNKVNVNLSLDQGKMQEDAETVKDKVAELTGKATAEVEGSGGQTTTK